MFYNQNNFITDGEVLQDKKKNGKDRPWRIKKDGSQRVSDSFRRLEFYERADRTECCGDELIFVECLSDGYKKLVYARFCKDRLCPMCNWRRSGMLGAQIMQILHTAVEHRSMRFLFLTLTVRNCIGDELAEVMDKLFNGFNRLFKYKAVDDVVVGWVRCLEITRNGNKKSKDYDTYHSHFHVLIGVRPDYFKGNGYLSQKEWTELWQKALKIDYIPIVDVRAVKPKKEGQTFQAAAVEAAKYSVKDSDYILDNENEMDSVIVILAGALKNRRLIGYGKLFKEIKSKLKLWDVEAENADLVGDSKHDCTCPLCGGMLEETLYKWHVGYRNYLSVEKEAEMDG